MIQLHRKPLEFKAWPSDENDVKGVIEDLHKLWNDGKLPLTEARIANGPHSKDCHEAAMTLMVDLHNAKEQGWIWECSWVIVNQNEINHSWLRKGNAFVDFSNSEQAVFGEDRHLKMFIRKGKVRSRDWKATEKAVKKGADRVAAKNRNAARSAP